MKTILTILSLFVVGLSFSQPDTSPIIVNVRNNAKLQWNGAAVKMKFRILQVRFISNGQKDFYFHGYLEMYENNAGSYGSKITDLISADNSLSGEEKADLLARYGDREIQYTTANKFVDSNGNPVDESEPGAIPELQYWQGFKLNNPNLGMTSASTQGALDAVYKIIIAIVNRLDNRKNI